MHCVITQSAVQKQGSLGVPAPVQTVLPSDMPSSSYVLSTILFYTSVDQGIYPVKHAAAPTTLPQAKCCCICLTTAN